MKKTLSIKVHSTGEKPVLIISHDESLKDGIFKKICKLNIEVQIVILLLDDYFKNGLLLLDGWFRT